jgi:hypothetical protein
MPSHQTDTACLSDSENNSVLTPPSTTSENTTTALLAPPPIPPAWIPSHGNKLILRSITCDNVLTFVDGHIVLAPMGGHGSFHWLCVETDGWFGFKNCVTSKFLGHVRGDTRLQCTADERGGGFKDVTITPVPEGGWVLQMRDWDKLRAVVVHEEGGKRRLKRTGEAVGSGIRWEFVRVE